MNLTAKCIITLPRNPRLTIYASAPGGKVKAITLTEAKNIVFGAVLRGDTVDGQSVDDPIIAASIHIIDKDDLAAARKEFDAKLQAAGLMPLELDVS